MVQGRIRVDLKFTVDNLKHNKTTCYILFLVPTKLYHLFIINIK